MNYSLVIKKNETQIHVTTWLNVKHILFSRINQVLQVICTIPFICDLCIRQLRRELVPEQRAPGQEVGMVELLFTVIKFLLKMEKELSK